MEETKKIYLKIMGFFLLIIAFMAGASFLVNKIKDWGYKASGYQTESGIELTIVDKDRHTSFLYTGKAMVPHYSYSIIVDLGDGTTHKMKCSSSEYNSVEVCGTALFSITKTKENELVEIKLE